MMPLYINDLHWQSDWNGDEVGYDALLVVGLYSSERLRCSFYIDMETGLIIEVLPEEDDEEF